MWFLLIIRVNPTKTPRASDRQCGAYSPENAGTTYMPSLLSTLVAMASIYVNRGNVEGTHLGAGSDHAEIVAQPLHQSSRDGDGSLQRVAGVPRRADLVRHRGDQAVLTVHDGIARVHQNEAPRAVRVLHFARFETRLAEESRLLVAQRS